MAHAFADWALGHSAKGADLAALDFPGLEHLLSNTSLLLIGAGLAVPGTAAVAPDDDLVAREHGLVIAKRTADGFKAALADRVHTVLIWPWDHIGTRVAWDSSKSGDYGAVAGELAEWSFGYVANHRPQVDEVGKLWTDVTAGVASIGALRLELLGGAALQEYLQQRLAATA